MVDLNIMGIEYINQKLNTKYLSINLPQMWHSYSMEKIIILFRFLGKGAGRLHSHMEDKNP